MTSYMKQVDHNHFRLPQKEDRFVTLGDDILRKGSTPVSVSQRGIVSLNLDDLTRTW